MNRVVLGVYGSTLDASTGRRNKWRPTVSLFQHEDFVIDRLELLHHVGHRRAATTLVEDIARLSPETDVRLHPVTLDDPWDFEEVFGTFYEFARSYRFQIEHENYLVHITTGTHVMQICWFLLTESRHFPAMLVQSSPPRRKGTADPGTYRIIDLDLSKYDRLATRFHSERADSLSFLKSGIDTRNEEFNRLIEDIERVAQRSKEPILLTGPTGAGKSQLARQIHQLKRNRRLIEGPLVEVNCATIRGDGAISALFGHVKGAYTGASRDRPGLLRAADGGMLFLDEIGELGLDEQAMLLRAIEDKRFLPVGTDREAKSDFALIAGTNRNLPDAVREGRFREDLLARIHVWTFALPGLAERREDIEPNLDFELARVAGRAGQQVTMNREARERFIAFATSPDAPWPGNFRDFNAAVLRMATLAPQGRIDAPTVQDEIRRLRRAWNTGAPVDPLEALLGPEAVAEIDPFDRPQLAHAIETCQTSASLSDAGRRLFSVSRQRKKSRNDADRLRKYLARFELSWQTIPR
ncbi:MAG: RNA repair transcriptional activator RtcR [Myxococcota bacterium]